MTVNLKELINLQFVEFLQAVIFLLRTKILFIVLTMMWNITDHHGTIKFHSDFGVLLLCNNNFYNYLLHLVS